MKKRKYFLGISALLFIAAIVVFINHRNEIDDSRDISKSFSKANERNENIDGWDNRNRARLNVDKTFSVRSWVHFPHYHFQILPNGEGFILSNMPVEVLRLKNDNGQMSVLGFTGPFEISMSDDELPDSTFNCFLTAQLELWENNIYPDKDLLKISRLWTSTIAKKEWNDFTNSYLYADCDIVRAIKLDESGCIKEVILNNDVSIIWGDPLEPFLNPKQENLLPEDYLTEELLSKIQEELIDQSLFVWYIPGSEDYQPIYTQSEFINIWQPRFYLELILFIGALVLLVVGLRDRAKSH